MKLKRHKLISGDEAKVLTKNFMLTLKNQEIDEKETWAWYDIDDLNEYFSEARNTLNNTNNKISGLKIYIGKYSGKKKDGVFTVYLTMTQKAASASLNTPKDAKIKLRALNLGRSGIEKH